MEEERGGGGRGKTYLSDEYEEDQDEPEPGSIHAGDGLER